MRGQAQNQSNWWTKLRKLQFRTRRLSGRIRPDQAEYCYFCKIQGHRQEECRKRMKGNKTCRDAQGRYYWPKVYFMEENEAKSVKAIEHEEVTFQDPFNIARLDTSTKNTSTRTAALPPQFSGFQ